jgi:hypothetical protein
MQIDLGWLRSRAYKFEKKLSTSFPKAQGCFMPNDEHVAILKKGVDGWNAWRVVNPGIRPELSGADLKAVPPGNCVPATPGSPSCRAHRWRA